VQSFDFSVLFLGSPQNHYFLPKCRGRTVQWQYCHWLPQQCLDSDLSVWSGHGRYGPQMEFWTRSYTEFQRWLAQRGSTWSNLDVPAEDGDILCEDGIPLEARSGRSRGILAQASRTGEVIWVCGSSNQRFQTLSSRNYPDHLAFTSDHIRRDVDVGSR
jgi:hypothetical protein